MSQGTITPKNKRLAILTLWVLGVAVVVVLLSGGNMLTKPFIQQKLQAFAERLSQDAAQKGMQASFTYEDVLIQGFLFNKEAVIKNPTLTIKRSSAFQQETTVINTESAIGAMDKILGKNLSVRFPSPIIISQNDKKLLTLQFDGVPAYMQIGSKPGSNIAMQHALSVPAKIMVTAEPEQAGAKPTTTIITYEPNPTLVLSYDNDGSMQSEVNIRNVKALVDGSKKTEVSISSIASMARQRLVAEQKVAFDSSITVNDIGIKNESGETGPYSVKLSVDGTSTVSADATAVQDTDMNIKEATFASDKYNVRANGVISRRRDDIMPFGMLDVMINHYPAFVSSNLFQENAKPLLMQVGAAITGQAQDQLEDVKFIIRREKMGTLMIGQMSFEQLVMLMLPQLQLQAPALGQALPAPATDSVAPIPPAPDVTPELALPAPEVSAAPAPVQNETPASPPVSAQ